MRNRPRVLLFATVALLISAGCGDKDPVSPQAVFEQGIAPGHPILEWDGIGIATGRTPPCDPQPPIPEGVEFDGTGTVDGSRTVPTQEPCNPPPPPGCTGFHHYAPPGVFGPSNRIASNLSGTVYYTIRAWPAYGDTTIEGQVTYCNESGCPTQRFNGEITIRTVGASDVRVRWRGMPFGTHVNGSICW